tara:strand:- start:407 stop:817 length:411 start_codon:yes stop_codon:yes gene_type:complete
VTVTSPEAKSLVLSLLVKVKVSVASFVDDPLETADALGLAAVIVSVGESLSLRVAVLLLWLSAVSLPYASYRPLSTGLTVITSVPSGVPVKLIPKVYTLPLVEILLGVELAIVAEPPLTDKAKSLISTAPLPRVVL